MVYHVFLMLSYACLWCVFLVYSRFIATKSWRLNDFPWKHNTNKTSKIKMIMDVTLHTLAVVLSMCFLWMSLRLRVKSNTLGHVCTSSVVLLICKLSLVLYSAGSGMKSVQVVLSELSMRLFELVKCRYCVGTAVCVWLRYLYVTVCCDIVCIRYEFA